MPRATSKQAIQKETLKNTIHKSKQNLQNVQVTCKRKKTDRASRRQKINGQT